MFSNNQLSINSDPFDSLKSSPRKVQCFLPGQLAFASEDHGLHAGDGAFPIDDFDKACESAGMLIPRHGNCPQKVSAAFDPSTQRISNLLVRSDGPCDPCLSQGSYRVKGVAQTDVCRIRALHFDYMHGPAICPPVQVNYRSSAVLMDQEHIPFVVMHFVHWTAPFAEFDRAYHPFEVTSHG